MIKLKETIIIASISIVTLILIVSVLGIYKFNYLQDDIYYENINHESVKWRSDEEFKLGENKLSIPDFQGALLHFNKSVERDSNNITAQYWKIFCEFNLKEYSNVIKHGETILTRMEQSDKFDDYIINTETVIGLSHLIKGNEILADNHFFNALKYVDSKLREKRDISYILNRATLLCYANQKEKALEYISSIQFNSDEIKLLGNQSPSEVIEQIELTEIINQLKRVD